MWTIFQIFIESVIILLLFYVLAFWPWGMWDLHSWAGTESLLAVLEGEVATTGPLGKSQDFPLKKSKCTGTVQICVVQGATNVARRWGRCYVCMCVFSHVWLFATLWIVAHQVPLSQTRTLEYVTTFLQEIFLTQGSNPHLLCLLPYRQILYLLNHEGSPGVCVLVGML